MKKQILVALTVLLLFNGTKAQKISLDELPSPILFLGNDHAAYRDPAVLCYHGIFYLFLTKVEIEPDGLIYMYVEATQSADLIHWTPLRKLTAKDQNLNFSSPGNVIRFQDEWLLCIQTYPRPGYTVRQMPGYGNQSARLFILRSKDLENWSEPELLKVKGPEVAVADMGRMIDPYLVEDKDEPGKYWCLYKQNGVSRSFTHDFKEWTYSGHTDSGENVCVLTDHEEYLLFHSPSNGIGIKKSKDLQTWKDWGNLITLGQAGWPWAKGRISAGAVIKLSENPEAKYLMFFHGSGPLTETQGDFDKNASVGIAWSNDLINWKWPGIN
ncbi:MAG: hypothetical protein WCP08_05075 [Prolixibacteraceae bacterium]